MQSHIPTLFLSIIVESVVLACAIAIVGYRQKTELMLWSGSLLLHGIAYILFALRGQISDLISIVVANTLLSCMFALIAEGLFCFLQRRPRRAWLWCPVPLAAIAFALLLDDFEARMIAGGLMLGMQGLMLLYWLIKYDQQINGRGKYIFAASALVSSLMAFIRVDYALSGNLEGWTLTTPSLFNTANFLLSLICVILFVIGLLLMTWESNEYIIKESEIRMRTLFESSSDAVMILDRRGFLDCNESTLRLFGCPSKEAFIQQSPAALSPPFQPCGTDSSSLAERHIETALQQTTQRFEWMHKRLDSDDTFPTEVLLNSMHFQGQQLLQAVVRDITERKRFQLELERQARLDYLTGLNNRGYFMQIAEHELSRAKRYQTPLSLLMMDVDYFKVINDTHGHKTGDRVLQSFAEICRRTLRGIDVVGRVGGEEFAVLLPETDIDQAIEVAERLRENIATTKVSINQGLPLNFTVSIGVTTLNDDNENIDQLFDAADKALYHAKKAGRNRVMKAINPNSVPVSVHPELETR